MKTKIAFILGLALVAGALGVQAQNTPAPSPSTTNTGGPAWRLTPEQRAERQQFIQATVLDLQARRDNGTLNANEKAWLDRMEQAGGPLVNGVAWGGGRGVGLGPRNGTGPRAQMGACPLVNGSPAVSTPAAGFRGRGFGMAWGGGRGWGQGGGFGMRNGTGPRARNGTCPLLAPPVK